MLAFSNKLRRRRSVKRKSRKLIRKRCNHSRSFSCYHYEQTVIVNGKKQHKSQNMCKCYDCGMEFIN
jgi:hypothetical protein